MESLFVLVFIAAVVAPIVAVVFLRKGEVLRFETLASPDEVMMNSVGQVGTARGWATVTQTQSNVAMTYVRQPNILIVVILFLTCVGIMPAVVYWWLASKKESLNILMSSSPTGNTRVQVTSNGWKGKRAGQAVKDAVGVAPGAAVTSEDNEVPPIPLDQPPATPALPSGAGPQPPAPARQQPQATQVPTQVQPQAAPANWYPDPDDPTQLRYFDGTNWTEHRSPKQG